MLENTKEVDSKEALEFDEKKYPYIPDQRSRTPP